MARGLSIFAFLFFLLSLGDFHKPADITGPEIAIGIAFWPAALMSVVLLLYGVVMLLKGKNRSYYLVVALCALPMVVRLGIGGLGQWQRKHHAQLQAAWQPEADALAVLLYRYSQLHPEQFHPIAGTDEEVTVDGFLVFCESQPEIKTIDVRHDSKQFLDFIGKPLHYYLAVNDKGRLSHWDGGRWQGSDWEVHPYPRGAVGISDNEGYYLASAPRGF